LLSFACSCFEFMPGALGGTLQACLLRFPRTGLFPRFRGRAGYQFPQSRCPAGVLWIVCAANGRESDERQAERIAKEGQRPLGFVRRYSASISGALPAFINPVHWVERGLKKKQ
jgi:hypothetical protein